jgi:hypothetical protein
MTQCHSEESNVTTVNITKLPKISAVAKVVSEVIGVPLVDLYSHRRPRKAAYARHVAWYVARFSLLKTYPVIGRSFNRDHTTVMHGVQKVQRMIEKDEGAYLHHIMEVRAKLGLVDDKTLLKAIQQWEDSAFTNNNNKLRAFAFVIHRDLERMKNLTAA